MASQGLFVCWGAIILALHMVVCSAQTPISCNQAYNSKTQTLQSSDPYENDLNCAFYISYENGLRTTVDFSYFDLEYKADYLYIGIGGSNDVGVENALYTFHGKTGEQATAPDSTVTIESGDVWFLFTSDVDVTASGFEFTYNVAEFCEFPEEYTESSGEITSPMYPTEYGSGYTCQNDIMVASDAQVLIQFHDVDIDEGDVVMVSDAESSWNISGSVAPKDYLSSSNQLTVTFISDNSYNNSGRGFRATYKEVRLVVPKPKGPTAEYTIEKSIGFKLSSLNYPQDYHDNSLYQFTVNNLLTPVMNIHILDLDLEEMYDMMMIGLGTSFGENVIYTFEENPTTAPDYLHVHGSEVWVWFKSDYNETASGFNLWFEPVDEMGPVKPPPPDFGTDPIELCGEPLFVKDPVNISHPEYPDNYNDNTLCNWQISNKDKGERLKLTFYDFETELSKDILEIGLGTDSTMWNSLYQVLSGTAYPSVMYLPSDAAWIKFETDYNDTYPGFKLQIEQALDPACYQMITLTSESPDVTISTPGFGSSNYLANQYCQWIIMAPAGSRLGVRFSDNFDTEPEYDLVEIGSGNKPGYLHTREKVYSGSWAEDFLAEYDAMWVTFTSDGSNEMGGFELSVSIEPTCGVVTLYDPSGVIESPWYPEMYPNEADCFWIIQVEGRFTIRLTFETFDLEWGHDKLYVGGVTAPEDGISDFLVMTGNTSEVLNSNYNAINLRFKSDRSNRAPGFRITYEQVYECAEGWEFGPDGETCYKFVTEAMSWLDARYECDNVREGDIVIITDQAELTYVTEKMANLTGGNGRYWVGAYDAAVEGNFEWGDCTSSTTFLQDNFNGAPVFGFPIDEDKDCAFYDAANDFFDDSECEMTYPFVCEITQVDNLDIYPRNLQGSAQGSRVVTLTWDVSPVNCDIDAYRLRYNTTSSGYVYILVPGADSDTVTVDGLSPDTYYNFEMTIVSYSYGNYSFRTAKSVVVRTDPLPTCPNGYIIGFDDGCYKIGMTPMTWQDARRDCASEQDSDLVNIETAEENEVLQGLLGDENSYWINLFDENTPDEFQWATFCIGPPYENWELGSPSSGTEGASKGCVELDGGSGMWRDESCAMTRMYVCEIRPRSDDIRDLSPTDVGAQPRGYSTAFVAWTPDDRTCDVVGYTIIASYNDGNDVRNVTEMIPGADSDNGFIDDLPGDTAMTITVTAESFTFGELDPKPFESAEITTLPVPLCPPFYERGYDMGCYRFVRNTTSWFAARAICMQIEHGDLAVIESDEELQFVLGETNGGDWWIGMSDLAVEDYFRWVTCEDVDGWAAGNWAEGEPNNLDGVQHCVHMVEGKWNDWNCDRPVNYICEINEKDFNSEDANPTNIRATPVSLTSVDVMWDVSPYSCDLTGYRLWVNSATLASPRVETIDGAETTSYELKDLLPDTEYQLRMAAASGGVVQPFTLPEVTIRTANETSGLCPQDYAKLYKDTCYKLGMEAVSWYDARADCQSAPGGDLMAINDDDEFNFIVGAAGTIEWWMGLYDLGEEGDWRWADCSDKDENNWFPGEPDNYAEQDCGYLQDGFFYDWQCLGRFPYVCEVMDKEYELEDANPSNVMYAAESYEEIKVSWTVSDYNCDVTGYKIRYKESTGVGDYEVVDVIGGETSEYIVGGLRSSTRYELAIAAVTLMGDLAYVESGLVNTPTYAGLGCVTPADQTDMYGVVESPYFPELYPPNLDCTWIFRYSEGYRLQLEFLSWLMVDNADYLEITELSPEHESRPVKKIFGSATPELYKSYGNVVSVRFFTSADLQSPGFQIAFEAIDEALPEDKDCSTDLTLKANSVLTIESEGYPLGYSEFQDCTWIVQSSGLGGVTLNFQDIDFDQGGGDFLDIGEGDTVSTDSRIVTYTELTDETLDIEANTVWINFKTDGGLSGRGFSLTAQDLIVVPPKSFAINSVSDNDVRINAVCEAIIMVPEMERAEVTSPGFDAGGYNNSEECIWTLRAQAGHRFRVTFSAFDVELGYDFVEVGYGDDANDKSTLLLRATGTTVPDTFMVPDDSGWVRFTSDNTTNRNGFAFYVGEDTGCHEVYTLPLGGQVSFQTPNYQNMYDNEEYCWWEINGDHTQNLRVDVEDFATEEGYDIMEMGYGGAPLLTSRFLAASGTVTDSISVGYFRVWVTFTSDSSNSDRGFRMTVYDDSCLDQSYTDAMGTIMSPGFPGNYFNNLECTWTITVTAGLSVRLTFQSFDLEYGRDFLYLRGTKQAPLEEWPLTGSEIPADIYSETNILTMTLDTDLTTVGSGFSLTYQETYYCQEGFVAGEGHDGPSCYYLGTTPKSWTDARAHCRSFENTDLVIVENAIENRFITGISGGEDWWIGFYDAQTEGSFYWADCVTSPNGHAVWNWNLTQPDNANGNEDCTVLLGANEPGYYADFPCTRLVKYICEEVQEDKSLFDPSIGNPTEVRGKATSQTSIRVRWTPSSAADNCDQIGYVVLYSADGGSTMDMITVDGVDTNMADIFNLTVYTTYTVWVVANTFSTGMGQRDDTIMVTTLSPAETYCPDGFDEGPDFTCFSFSLASDASNWHDARRACEQTPMGDLAVIDTREELVFLESHPDFNGSPFWIGLNDLAVEGDFQWSDCQDIMVWQQLNFALGEPDDTDGTQNCVAVNGNGQFIDTQCSGVWQYICEIVEKDYEFEDQFPLSFTASAVSPFAIRTTWVASEYNCDLLGYKLVYNNGIGDSGFVQVDDPRSGTVLVEDLQPDTNYAIGIMPFNSREDLPLLGETNVYTLPLSSLCPEDYIIGYDYGCYQFISEHKTWEDARMHCQQATEGDLAIIDESAEVDFLIENGLLEGYDWWIGLTDRAMEGQYYWTDCSGLSPFSLGQWAPGQPSDVDGSDNCVQLSDNAQFNDRDCTSSFPFICEINLSNYQPEQVVPRRFSGTATSHRSIDLSWIPSLYTCEVSGYRVYYGMIGAEWEMVEVMGGTSNGVTINNLQVATQYGFQLNTVTLEGERPEFLETTVTTQDAPPCPPMYERGVDDNCYYFVRNTTTWAQARSYCQQVEDGDLVIIDSQEKLDYVLSMTMNADFWIGAYDQSTEGRWRWVDCMDFNDFSSSNWAVDQPSGNMGEDCGQLLPDGRFNDWPCDRPLQYICQTVHKGFEPEEANPSNIAASVASFTSVYVSWMPSTYNCDVVGYRVWVSTPDNSTQSREIMVDGGDTSMYEVMDLMPETTYSFSVAAVTLSGTLPYVMPGAMVTLPDETADLCPQGYSKLYNDGCYKIGTEMLSWYDARSDCQKTPNSDLININSAEEDMYFRNVGFGADWWIGLYDIGREGDFRWTDCSSTMDFQNWGANQPDDYEGNEDCVLITDEWFWNDWDCTERVMYLCEINEDGAPDPSEVNPSSFMVSPVSYSMVEVTWNLGSKICDVLGYNIRYRPAGTVTWQQAFAEGGDTTEFMLEGLRPATSYQISVSARTWTTGDLEYLPSSPVTTPVFDAPGCDGNPETIDHGVGNISSPLSPDQYPPNVECVYIFEFDEGSRIEFQYFLWALTDTNDYVEITELNPEYEDVPPKIFTGLLTPKVYLSYGNRIQVKFVSNNEQETLGYIILYRPVERGVPSGKCEADFTLKANAPALQIQSEGYPSSYPPYEDCTWIVRAGNPSNVVALDIFDISLEENCDWVDIGTGSDPTNMDTFLYRYDGSGEHEDIIYSDSSALWIRFRSDNSEGGRGVSFGALEWSGDPVPTKSSGFAANAVIQADCDATIDVPMGGGAALITSPGYPNVNYNNSESCLWSLRGNVGRRYKVIFDSFETEEGYDFVEVGTSSSASPAGVYWPLLMASGNTIPGHVVINNVLGSIQFTSDASGTAKGFQIRVEEDVDCEAILNVPAGGSRSFSTPGYPSTDYANEEFCFWTIQGESGVNLRGMVNGISLEEGYDYVDMGSGSAPTNLNTRLMKASSLPMESFAFGSDTAWVVFTSDSSVRNDGLQMTFYDDACVSKSITGEMGMIQSPGFGAQYFNLLSCEWTITVASEYVVRLSFQSFDLETDRDFLSVVDTMDAPLETLYLTGSTIPDDVLSRRNTVVVRFETDGSNTRAGFELTWSQDYNCPEGFEEGIGSYGPSCYKFGTTLMTWQNARRDCRQTPNADLVIVENAIENRFIREMSGGVDWWIGIYDGSMERLFYQTDCTTNLLGFGRVNWNLTQPDNANGNEDCVAMLGEKEAGYYADFDCTLLKNYVCEIQEEGVLYDPMGYMPMNVNGEGTSATSLRVRWKQAPLDECDLIGYTVFYTGNGPTMSTTVMGSDSIYIDIENLEPSTTYTISVWPNTFSFGAIQNDEEIMIPTLSSQDVYCPDGYIEGPEYSCYRISTTTSTWQAARDACKADDPNGELAVVENQEQADFLVEQTSGTEDYWIGLNDHSVENDFRWTDCTFARRLINPWQALNWAEGEPSSGPVTVEQDCVVLNPDGEWADEVCSMRRKYICEIVHKGYVVEDSYPIQFNFMITSALTAQATWVFAFRYNCDILGYRVYISDGLNPELVTDRRGGNTAVALITDLRPETSYAVSYAPYNAYGDLPRVWDENYITPPAETLCEDGYIVGYNYGCYKFVSDVSLSWSEARAECQMVESSDLAIIDDADELQFIVDAGLAAGFDWWIGLSDRASEGQYYWTDCSMASNFTLSNWDVMQPSDTDGSENCVVLQDNGKINDRDCSRSFAYVCEVNPTNFDESRTVPLLFRASAFNDTTIELSWLPRDSNCDLTGYRITYFSDPMSKSYMTVPGKDSSGAVVGGLMPETLYTFYLATITADGVQSDRGTATESTLPPINPCPEGWVQGYLGRCYRFGTMPMPWYEAREDCRSIEDGDLVVIETSMENEFIYNLTQGGMWWIGYNDIAVEGQFSWVDCDAPMMFAENNWEVGQPDNMANNQDCVILTNSGRYNDWDCMEPISYLCEQSPKGYLPEDANPRSVSATAVNPSTVEVSWVPETRYNCDVLGYRVVYPNPTPVVVDVPGADSTSITITDLQDDTTYWISVGAYTYFEDLPYLNDTTVTTPSQDDLCEEGWVPGYDFKCYKFGTEMLSWEEARLDCQSIPDGDLVVFETEEEWEFVSTLGVDQTWWLGLFDRATEGEYRWVTCDPLDTWASNNWAPGQPNDLQGSQDCVQMLGSGMWNDLECSATSLYVCEVTVKDYTIDDQSPSLLAGEAVDPYTVELTWVPSDYNCEVLGYIIYIQEGINSMEQTVEGGDTSSTLVKNLEPSTTYVFDIAAYTTYNTLPAVGRTARVTMPSPSSGECGPTSFTSESGVILSPNYPKEYSNNLQCSYFITLPDASNVVQLFLNSFSLESGHDFLTIGTGEELFANTEFTLTGSEVPGEITTNSHMVWMFFSSDESVGAPGFSISFESLEVERSGAATGSVTILVMEETPESFTEMEEMFKTSISNQLNVYCAEDESNCLAGPEATFTAENIIIEEVVEVQEGVEVTFWVSNPTDATGSKAGLTTKELESALNAKESDIEDGGQFDFVVRDQTTKAFDEPWVIAVTAVGGFCVLLILLVLVKNCFCPRTKKGDTLSEHSDDVEMVRNNNMESGYNNNAAELEDEIKRVPVDDDPSTLYTVPSTKGSMTKTTAKVESSQEGSTSSALDDTNEPGSSTSSFTNQADEKGGKDEKEGKEEKEIKSD